MDLNDPAYNPADDPELQAHLLPRYNKKAMEERLAAALASTSQNLSPVAPGSSAGYLPGFEDFTNPIGRPQSRQVSGDRRGKSPLPLDQPYVGCRGPGDLSTHTMLTLAGEIPPPPPPIQEPVGIPLYRPFDGPVQPPKAPRRMIEMRHTGQRARDRETGLPIPLQINTSNSEPTTPSPLTLDATQGSYYYPAISGARTPDDHINGVMQRLDELEQQNKDLQAQVRTMIPEYDRIMVRITELEMEFKLIDEPIRQQALEEKYDQVLAAIKIRDEYEQANPTPTQAAPMQATYAQAIQVPAPARIIPALPPPPQRATPTTKPTASNQTAANTSTSSPRSLALMLNDIDRQNRAVWMARRPKKDTEQWYEYCRIAPACFGCGDPNHTTKECRFEATAEMWNKFYAARDRAAQRDRRPNLQVYAPGVQQVGPNRAPPTAGPARSGSTSAPSSAAIRSGSGSGPSGAGAGASRSGVRAGYAAAARGGYRNGAQRGGRGQRGEQARRGSTARNSVEPNFEEEDLIDLEDGGVPI